MTITSQITLKGVNVWWYHVGENLQGNVLLIGSFPVDTVNNIEALSQTLLLCTDPQELQPLLIKCSKQQLFDAIIINNQTANCTDSTVLSLARKALTQNGKMCIFEENKACLSNAFLNPAHLLAHLLGKNREAKLTNKTDSLAVEVYSAISYSDEPYESMHNGLYNSNKNIFLLKEKIKGRLFSSRFQQLFSNSNIILLLHEKNAASLIALVLDKLEQCLPRSTTQFLQCSNILYNNGKMILTFSNSHDIAKSYIVVIAFGSCAEEQRLNELKAIRRLSQDPEMSRYISPENYHTQLMGYNCFIMRRCLGMTVDINTPKLAEMTENAYRVLMNVSRKYRAAEHDDASLFETVTQYMNAVKQRLPDQLKLLNRLQDVLMAAFPRDSLFPCLFHGDLKIENFVFDKDFSVVGIIDWELYEEQAFPLLDLLYLLVYNIIIRDRVDFLEAFTLLMKGQLPSYESTILSNYLNAFSIDTVSLDFFYGLFFIHHFGCRVTIPLDNITYTNRLQELLNELVNLLEVF